jgi:trans-aconitate 2-methyltransferase
VKWDPKQYGRYADERGRPFVDLVDRIGAESPRRVVDLGCGPGNLTELLAQRWPGAIVEGTDSSPEMITTARAIGGPVAYRVEDVNAWQPTAEDDVVVCNAVLQWVPGHRELLRRWSSALPSQAWLAVQVPDNFAAPSHELMRTLAASDRWAGQLGGRLRHDDAVGSVGGYAEALLDAGMRVDAWETTYLHVLPGTDPVLEWVRGTGPRPILNALGPADAAVFEAEYAQALRSAYPAGPHGTIFPFKRIFVVAQKA